MTASITPHPSYQLERREMRVHQLETDLTSSREMYRESVEENGRLEARIQAFNLNAQSEQDLLSGEVTRREETIQRLRKESLRLQETVSQQEDRVTSIASGDPGSGNQSTTCIL